MGHSRQQSSSPTGGLSNLSAKLFDSENPQNVIFLVRFADFARTCAVIVNVPDLKAYSS
eukprot:COSAG01_NODE_35512_length_530_cov_13.974478_1_plen_58_part_10